MTDLRYTGFRFVLRSEGDAKWVHPADVRPDDVDCTGMDDDAFYDAYSAWIGKVNETIK